MDEYWVMTGQWVVGNWKQNGDRQMLAAFLPQIAQAGLGSMICLAVPFSYLDLTFQLLQGSQIKVGAQDVSRYDGGSYTGEVSAKMIADVGSQFTLIGHSERRHYFAESNEVLRCKVECAIATNLTVIFCVGEDVAVRQSGRAVEYVLDQLEVMRKFDLQKFLVAYEPVWAIGSGLSATSDEIRVMHQAIKAHIGQAVPVLYGGSVNSSNAQTILSVQGVDGLLVGGASLKANEFIEISRCANLHTTVG